MSTGSIQENVIIPFRRVRFY